MAIELVTRQLINTGEPLCYPDGSLYAGKDIAFTLVLEKNKRKQVSLFDAISGEFIVGGEVTVTTDQNGEFSVLLWPNGRGEFGTLYRVVLVDAPDTKPLYIKIADGLDKSSIFLTEAVAAFCGEPEAPTVTLFQAILNTITEQVSSFTSTVSSLAPKDSPVFTGVVAGVTKAMVGLGFVDNTPDNEKPISTDTQAALDLKASVNDLNLKAPIESPTFTTKVTAPAAKFTSTYPVAPTANSVLVDYYSGARFIGAGATASAYGQVILHQKSSDGSLFRDALVINSAGNVTVGSGAMLGTRFDVGFGDTAGNSIGFAGDGSINGSAICSNWTTGLASYLDFRLGGSTSASTKLRINKSGNVLVGTVTDDGTNKLQVNGNIKASKLLLGSATTSNGFIDGKCANSSIYLNLNMTADDDVSNFQIVKAGSAQYPGGPNLLGSGSMIAGAYACNINSMLAIGQYYDDDTVFVAQNTEAARLDKNGLFTFWNGIKLPNSVIASATVLDWYEEGTWTPVASGLTVNGGTPNYTGSFTRIGNKVFCNLHVQSVGGTTQCINPTTYFTGIPYSQSGYATCAAVNESSIASYGVGMVALNRVYPPSWPEIGNGVTISFTYTAA